MCELNPKFTRIFRLEVFAASISLITQEEFDQLVAEKLSEAEQQLNRDMRLRFHIHECETNTESALPRKEDDQNGSNI